MDPLFPDEILSPDEPIVGLGAVSNLDAAALQEQVNTLIAQHSKNKAIPYFVLGLVGGAIGAKVLKGALGVAVAGGLGWWAYSSLTKQSTPAALPQNGGK
jgi:hypothetical protein